MSNYFGLNVRTIDNESTSEILYILSADFPNLVQNIALYWGCSDFNYIMETSLMGKDEYPYWVVSYINKLWSNHDKEYPEFKVDHKPFSC